MDQIRIDDIVPANPRQAAVDRTLRALLADKHVNQSVAQPKSRPSREVETEQQITPQRD